MRFDPYSEWLGLPVGPRPPHPYALLGLPLFERDSDRIAAAAEARMRQVRHQAPFDRIAESQRLLQEIRSARDLLTDPERRRRLELRLRRGEKRPLPALPVNEQAPRSQTLEAALAAPKAKIAGAALVATGLLGAGIWALWPESRSLPPADATADRNRPVDGPPFDAATHAIDAPQRTVAAAPEPSPAVAKPAPAIGRSADRRPRDPLVAPRPATQPALVQSASDSVRAFGPVEARRPLVRSLAGYRLPTFESASDANAYAEHLRQLLAEGFEFKGGELKTAVDHHRSATSLAADAALADYALGLAYWKRLQLDKAADRLEASRGTVTSPCLPAWRALIQLHLKRNQREPAFHEAAEFANALAGVDGNEAVIQARDESLRWLGRLTAALESPWQEDGFPSQDLIDLDAAIRKTLGPDLAVVYERGRRSLRDDYAVQAEEVQAEVARLATAHAERQAEALESISGDRDAAKDQQARMVRTAAEWDNYLDEQTSDIDAQLEKLTPQFRQLSVQAEAAWTTLSIINEQITIALETPEEQRPRLPLIGSANLLTAREQALVRYRTAAGRAAEVRRQAELLVARRRAVANEYERATQKLASESDALKKWDDVLQRRATKTAATEVEESPAVRSLRRRVQEITTYIPFDLDAERATILKVLEGAGRTG